MSDFRDRAYIAMASNLVGYVLGANVVEGKGGQAFFKASDLTITRDPGCAGELAIRKQLRIAWDIAGWMEEERAKAGNS